MIQKQPPKYTFAGISPAVYPSEDWWGESGVLFFGRVIVEACVMSHCSKHETIATTKSSSDPNACRALPHCTNAGGVLLPEGLRLAWRVAISQEATGKRKVHFRLRQSHLSCPLHTPPRVFLPLTVTPERIGRLVLFHRFRHSQQRQRWQHEVVEQQSQRPVKRQGLAHQGSRHLPTVGDAFCLLVE